jgi:DtxR family Mn-dependent transcriptional regulator
LKKTKEKEHYLKEIYKLVELDEKVSVSQLSLKLGVSKSSVSNMLKKLVSMGLVSTGPYKPILLTKKGNNLSKKLLLNTGLLNLFLLMLWVSGQTKFMR